MSSVSEHLHSLLVLVESCPPEQQDPVQGQPLAGFPQGARIWLLGQLLRLDHCLQAIGGGGSWD